MVSFPYYSHTTPIRIPKDMGSLYGSRLPFSGVPCPSLGKTGESSPLKLGILSRQLPGIENMKKQLQGGPPSSYKWSYNPYNWPYNWVTGVITPISEVITLLITGRGPIL